ncbi:MAG: O-unit flippase-like protein [Bacteroidales bacterium]|nr:O-unit flippase-like protein [Bacteroidales bacterium]MDD3990426.1 O-unit flippase-like protein [Bacteroidales bacterium]MDD4639395.1 O-unit flippase-like protein [Bacteroidales bacterium]
MKVSRGDLFWNYGATFMRVASGLIVLPLILRMLPSQEVGLWTVMISLNSIIYLLDFGFFQTFSRSVTYIFSGAKELISEGIGEKAEEGSEISFPLLKGALKAMRNYYAAMSFLLLIVFLTGGYFYIEKLLEGFLGDPFDAKMAWYLYGIMLCFQFYTYYYDALLTGRGMIKRSRQIIVLSQSAHIVIASLLLINGVGLLSMVIGQITATIINRWLSRRSFYDCDTLAGLRRDSKEQDWVSILKTLWNTAYKSGLASLSWIFTNRMLVMIGSLYIPLAVMGSYGTSKVIVDITYTLSLVWFGTYYPRLTEARVKTEDNEVKRIYIKARIIAVGVFLAVAAFTLLFGEWGISFIKSSTSLLDNKYLILLFAAALLEALTYLSTSVLLSRNAVPHYKSQSITAVITLISLFAVMELYGGSVLALILIPAIAQLLYLHWRWTLMVFKELRVRFSDYLNILKQII